MQKTKTGGRQIGTPNKITSELRALLKELVFAELENLPDYLPSLESKERLELLIKLLPYVMPKVLPMDATDGEPLNFGW